MFTRILQELPLVNTTRVVILQNKEGRKDAKVLFPGESFCVCSPPQVAMSQGHGFCRPWAWMKRRRTGRGFFTALWQTQFLLHPLDPDPGPKGTKREISRYFLRLGMKMHKAWSSHRLLPPLVTGFTRNLEDSHQCGVEPFQSSFEKRTQK